MRRDRKKKRTALVVAALTLMMGITGCGNQIPELTDEQVQMVGEFVAATVMKYDKNHGSRLVELPETDFQTPAEPTPTQVPSQEPDASGQEPSGEDVSGSGPEEVVNSYTLEEVLGLAQGVTVVFTGQQVCDRYSEGDIEGFCVPAADGKKLLVLNFIINNGSEQEQKVDILSSGAIFGITVNGEYVRRALKTMLPEDMSTIRDLTLGAGEGMEAVLIIEVDNETAENISTAVLNVKNDSKAYTIQLF
jgi:hypothetical protein